MDALPDKEILLHRYLNNQCSPEERVQVDQWLLENSSDPSWQKAVADYWTSLEYSTQGTNDPHVEERLALFYTRVGQQPDTKRVTVWPIFFKIAASLLMCLVAGYSVYRFSHRASAIAYETRYVPPGERSQLQLPDGSIVHLQGGSEIKIPKGFSADQRETFIKGQVFFEVKKDATRPFVVHAGGLDIRVVGTSFNVSSYAEDSVASVTVVTGKVAVSRSGTVGSATLATLSPGQQARLDYRTDVFDTASVDTTPYISWTTGTIIFRKAPLSEAVKVLERTFGVEITINNERFASCRVSGKFPDASLSEILKTLSLTNQFEYRKEGRRYHLEGPGC